MIPAAAPNGRLRLFNMHEARSQWAGEEAVLNGRARWPIRRLSWRQLARGWGALSRASCPALPRLANNTGTFPPPAPAAVAAAAAAAAPAQLSSPRRRQRAPPSRSPASPSRVLPARSAFSLPRWPGRKKQFRCFNFSVLYPELPAVGAGLLPRNRPRPPPPGAVPRGSGPLGPGVREAAAAAPAEGRLRASVACVPAPGGGIGKGAGCSPARDRRRGGRAAGVRRGLRRRQTSQPGLAGHCVGPRAALLLLH